MTSPSDDRQGQARKITPTDQPVFPCWLWHEGTWTWQRPDESTFRLFTSAYTHWHPDQPTPPSVRPFVPAPHGLSIAEAASGRSFATPSTPSPGALPGEGGRREAELALVRLKWLHDCSKGTLDDQGYEWGIFRVKWDERGRPVDVLQTFSDMSDLDEEMRREMTGLPHPRRSAPTTQPTTQEPCGGRCGDPRCELDTVGNPLPQESVGAQTNDTSGGGAPKQPSELPFAPAHPQGQAQQELRDRLAIMLFGLPGTDLTKLDAPVLDAIYKKTDEVIALVQRHAPALQPMATPGTESAGEREACLADVDAEIELPGDMPDEMWLAISTDRDTAQEALRATVRLTKKGIADRIKNRALSAQPAKSASGADELREILAALVEHGIAPDTMGCQDPSPEFAQAWKRAVAFLQSAPTPAPQGQAVEAEVAKAIRELTGGRWDSDEQQCYETIMGLLAPPAAPDAPAGEATDTELLDWLEAQQGDSLSTLHLSQVGAGGMGRNWFKKQIRPAIRAALQSQQPPEDGK